MNKKKTINNKYKQLALIIMKKILFATLAVAAIASCAKTEPTYVGGESEIMLAPVTAVSTKHVTGAVTGTTYNTDEKFDVYAYWADEPAGTKFNTGATEYLKGEGSGVEFKNKGSYWGGTTTYYWPKNGSLRFAAYSPSTLDMIHDLENDTYTLENYVYPAADATAADYTAKAFDILVAPTSESYNAETAASKVSVKFEHALSWITVKLQSTEVAEGAFTVKDVVVNNIAKKGTLTANMAAEKVWSNLDNKSAVNVFTDATGYTVTPTAVVKETVSNGFLVLPQEPTTVTVYYTQNALEDEDGNETSPALENQQITVPLTLDDADDTWEPGKHYTYTILFDLDEILINPSVEDWEETTEVIVNSSPVKVNTSAELVAAVAEGKDVVLEQSITLDEPVVVEPVVATRAATAFEVTIDLNGKDIIAPSSDAIVVDGGAHLTINGNGKVHAATDNATSANAVWVKHGNVTINGGDYFVGKDNNLRNDCIYVGASAYKDNAAEYESHLVINGGTFAAEVSPEDGKCWVLNLKDEFYRSNSTIKVYGGTFKSFDPAAGGTENPAANFVAEGYGSYELEAGVWTVAKTTDKIEVASNAALEDVAAQGGNAVLTADLTLSAQELNVAEGKTVTLDLGGKTLTVAALDPIKNNGTMTIANGKITAGAAENTRRCVYNYGTMTIDGVEFVQAYSKKGAAINNEGVMTINDAVVDAVFYSVWTSGANAVTTINGGSFTTTNDVSDKETWAYAIRSLSGSKTVIYDATVVGNHGCVAADTKAEVEVNSGKYNCTATYTGNSDWVFYAEDATLTYDANACELTTANPNGAILEGCTTVTAK